MQYKIIIFLCLLTSLSNFMGQDKFNKIDSVKITMSLDPGSGSEYNRIKLKVINNSVFILYSFYQSENFSKVIEKVESENLGVISQSNPSLFVDKYFDIREVYTNFHHKKIKLTGNPKKDILFETIKIANLANNDLKKDENVYLHGVTFQFVFFNEKNKRQLILSNLNNENYKTIYLYIKHLFSLLKAKYPTENFEKMTFGY